MITKFIIQSIISMLAFSYLVYLGFVYRSNQVFSTIIFLLSIVVLGEFVFKLKKFKRNSNRSIWELGDIDMEIIKKNESLLVKLGSNSKKAELLKSHGLLEKRMYFKDSHYLSFFFLNDKKVKTQILSLRQCLNSFFYQISVDLSFIIASSERRVEQILYKPDQITLIQD